MGFSEVDAGMERIDGRGGRNLLWVTGAEVEGVARNDSGVSWRVAQGCDSDFRCEFAGAIFLGGDFGGVVAAGKCGETERCGASGGDAAGGDGLSRRENGGGKG